MDHWIISCNIKEYDVIGSFKVFQIIDWKQSANFNISDFIYIYISHPVKEIRYKCKVVQINLTTRDMKDVIYTRSGNSYENDGRFMRIELVSVFSIPIASEELLENGLTGRIQGPRRLNGALLDFVKNREAHIFKADFLTEKDEKYGGVRPYRTNLGPRYIGGFSDHFPIYMDLIIKHE